MSQKKDLRDKSVAKKAAVLGSGPKKSATPLLLMIACAVLVIGGGVLFLGPKGQERGLPAGVASQAHAGEVTHPVSAFQDGTSRFYEHKTPEGLTIRYFILRSSDGVIRSAFDACDACWPAGKGYRQDGDEMVCQNCRMRFASTKIMEVKGGCNPSPLRNEIRGDVVVIKVEDILAGRSYFDHKKEG